ncbi:hypothetical protein MPTK1_1g29430 [Marchantia polymorpha subsp. ruderalis]|uniref:Protein kinase domain-containing protein n=2 Tax=Marchantia polymorpha TaxID=3197 RepID=A0AAF6AVJ0_MARPO|nr:hypothetical protein MARPO_0107s0058 [Marchantia polymorpha]BBN00461.1 hypothetical protein Mp_1g29430 [Marchantia polymorpha subsp. ruderalis]|eukprot:PTQ31791.1 hypothetical protein MARPO_0107s0058 [Marchantia polymorpha]
MARPNSKSPQRQRGGSEQPFLKAKILLDDSPREIKQHYISQKIIGQGPFGDIFEVIDAHRPRVRLAMKVQKKKLWINQGSPAEQALKLFKELLILNRILPRHPNIARIQDLLIGPNSVFIIQELCSAKTLDDFYPVATEASGRRIFRQIVDAVTFIHHHGVAHLGLQGENILFAEPDFKECKIIDFSSSVYNPDWATLVHNNFNPLSWFLPDELTIPRDKRLDDVKNLGRILHCILVGQKVQYRLYTPALLGQSADRLMAAANKPRKELFGPQAFHLLKMIGPPPFGPSRDQDFPTMEEIRRHTWLYESDPEDFQQLRTRLKQHRI